MKNFYSLAAAAVVAIATGVAHAEPTLQLGITDGVYDTATQTVFSNGDNFTLSAYLIADSGNTLTDFYYLSYAVVPKVSVGANLGSFTINGVTINVTGDMVFGTPPIDTVATQLSDPGDLSDHGIFDTYFQQKEFQFSSTQEVAKFDTQTNAGDGPADHPGTGMYYMSFEIDTSGLLDGYEIHFDLYNTKACTTTTGQAGSQCQIIGDIDQTQFAPYSHDAQSRGGDDDGGDDNETIPEPGTIALLGAALAGMAASRRKRNS